MKNLSDLPLKDIPKYFKNLQELGEYLSKEEFDNKPVEVPSEFKEAALKLKTEKEVLTTAMIQKNMRVGYPMAAAIFDWLKDKDESKGK